MSLKNLVIDRTVKALGITEPELIAITNEDRSILHNPMLYDGMELLIFKLHEYKEYQKTHPQSLLVVDTDYDTDGIMSAAVLSAALDVFNINYRVYIPSMDDGYGLNINAVNEMKTLFEINGFKIDVILTADNGTNAIEGVDYANELGIMTLVTDHHLGGVECANAEVIVNPNKPMPDGSLEPYPFKGNAGGAVAWKTMLAYAARYQPDVYELIYDLVVFAGIANVADVMPIIDENHFMVKEAVKEIKRLINLRMIYNRSDMVYNDIKATPYTHYNSVFYGLYDIILLVQENKDKKRFEQGKNSIPLPDDEEFISWYFSPMMNAPRRIHATSREAMLAMLETRLSVRHENIESMIHMNEEKSKLRNDVLDTLDYATLSGNSGNVLFVNTQHGISGLVAGQIAEKTKNATIVFSFATDLPQKIYSFHEFDMRQDRESFRVGASARSNPMQPLNVIVERIAQKHPEYGISGGGHAAAAGYSIKYKYLSQFHQDFNQMAELVREEMKQTQKDMIKRGEIVPVPDNVIKLSFVDVQDTLDYAGYNVTKSYNLASEMLEVLDFQAKLKPFGKDFNGQTQFIMDLNPSLLTHPDFKLNMKFWKTFKFEMSGVEVLTFDIQLGDLVKDRIATHSDTIIPVKAELKINNYNGRIKPQLILSRI